MVLLSARIRIIHSLVCFITAISLNAAEIIKGDDQAPEGTTFSFPVKKIVRDKTDNVLFIGALEGGAGVYSLSADHPLNQRIQPISPEKVSLNNQEDQENPLYNQGVAFLDIVEKTDGKRSPIVVPTNDLTRVYLIQDFTRFDRMSLFATQPLLDFNMLVTKSIVGIAGFRGGLRSAALAAVTPNGTGIFGDPGSGFTSISYQQVNYEIKKEDCDEKIVRTGYTLNQVAVTAFSRASTQIAINNSVTSITNNVAMLWNRSIQLGYVGMQLVGGAGATDGALSLMLAQVDVAGAITLRPFAPATAFDTAGDQIIGGIGASIPLSVQSINSMETSTELSYVIIQGGNGTPEDTQSSVYALPVINARNTYGAVANPAIQGVLASKNATVHTFYDGNQPSRLRRRRFVEPAVTPADTPRATDPAVLVGGGPIAQGSIEAVNVVHDAVIISVSEAPGYYEECRTGMFISRAIFSATGAIKAWTPWERIGGVAEQVFDTELSTDSGNITYFTGANALSINTIYRTQWGYGSNPGLKTFVNQINSIYPAVKGGVQGLKDVPFGTPGLNTISMLVVGGDASVTLAEVGSEDYANGNQQCPITGDYGVDALTFENGTISESITGSPLMLTIQGGALADVGPIVTSAIVADTFSNQGYLFVGGSHGLAVLTKPDGSGWDLATGLGPNFAGLTNGMLFKTVGNYCFVRNLLVDGNFLYVVSAKRIDRIDLSTAPTFTATTIASASSLVFDKNDTILDGAFSGKLGLIATTKGVFRTSNGNDVSSITSDENSNWTTLQVPSGVVPPQQFFVSSTTGNPADFASAGPGGMFHLLSAYLGANRARVNRFAVNNVAAASIDDNTVLPLPDGEIEGYNTSFLTFNGFRSTYTCDGALSLHSIGRTLLISPYVKTRSFRSGSPVPLDDGNGTLIGQVLRSSTSGSWLVAGDFGIRINE